MSSITDDVVVYYDETIDTLISFYDNIIEFIDDNLFVLSVLFTVLVLLVLTYLASIIDNPVADLIKSNIGILFGFLVMTLIFYILYVFYDKSREYSDLKSFIGSRTEKLDKIFDNINTNNTNFVKNDIDVCKKLKTTGSS